MSLSLDVFSIFDLSDFLSCKSYYDNLEMFIVNNCFHFVCGNNNQNERNKAIGAFIEIDKLPAKMKLAAQRKALVDLGSTVHMGRTCR